MWGLCKGTGMTQNISMAYHPRTDGQSECTNQWLEQYLWFWINERQDNWHHYLPLAEFAHNNWPSETTGESPFFILYGFNPHADWTNKPTPIPQVALRIDQFKWARQHAQELMIKAQQSWVKHRDTPKYKEGDLVWLKGCHLRCKASLSVGLETIHIRHSRYWIGPPTISDSDSHNVAPLYLSIDCSSHLSLTSHTHTLSLSLSSPCHLLPTCSPSHCNGRRRSPHKFIGRSPTSRAFPCLMLHSTPLVDHFSHAALSLTVAQLHSF